MKKLLPFTLPTLLLSIFIVVHDHVVSQEIMVGGVTYGSLKNGWDDWTDCQLTDKKWIYVAYSKDQSNNSKLYLNGNLIKQSTYQNLPYKWGSLRLGTDLPTSVNSFFNGKIDELRISNVVRTSNEISEYYNSKKPFNSDQGTIGLYNFNQSENGIINSSKGPQGTGYNTSFTDGFYGNSIYFNGKNSYADFQLNIPETNLTVEFWLYIETIEGNYDWVINYPGLYGAGFEIGLHTPENPSRIVIEKKDQDIIDMAMKNLEFETNRSNILSKSKPYLDKLAEILNSKTKWNVLLCGHTDNVGNADANLMLSKNRVEAVKDYLVSKGVSSSRFKLTFFGEAKPIADNNTPEGRQKNRRVEFTIVSE
jgi:outer membrane protein OmpA-like peptidoglycan-associated protein